MKTFYNVNPDEILKEFNSSALGLDDTQVSLNREKYGKNKLEEKEEKNLIEIFVEQFKDLLVIILILSALISAATGNMESTAVIIVVLILNAILGTVQTIKAQQSLESLKKLSSPSAKVVRQGDKQIIDAVDLVCGDIVLLEAGDIIPGDGRIIENFSLKTNESALTGESENAEKEVCTLYDENIALGDQRNMVFSGSLVTYGRATAITTGVGRQTELGRIAGLMNDTKERKTPLQTTMDNFSKKLSIGIILICILVFGLSLYRGMAVVDALLFAVALAVAAIPEALSSIITISLAIGTSRMADENAIIKKLEAVEGLGCVSIICSDKTGTLTQNKMTVEYESPWNGQREALYRASLLCNDTNIVDGKTVGDPTETAFIDYYRNNHDNYEYVKDNFPRLGEVPFDSDRKLMSTLHPIEGGKFVMYTKGALDVILSRTNNLSKEDKEAIRDENFRLSNDGLRVLAFAQKIYDKESILSTEDEFELSYIGLMAEMDPPREESAQAVSDCIAAGIKPVMITGDHKITASAIAKRIGIMKEDDFAITGPELDNMSQDELNERLEHISVYARVSPDNKIRIVNAWQEKGHIVSMTGDGVNDGPALKSADVGVAMGITGTEVAKDSASMILTDDNFATIIKSVLNGRNVYTNIKNAIKFLLSGNAAGILAVLYASFMALPMPFTAVQLLFINLITDSLPALAISMEPSNPALIRDKPRPRDESVLNPDTLKDISFTGLLMAIATIIAFMIGLFSGDDLGLASENGINTVTGSTMAFGTLCLSRLWHGFNCRGKESIVNLGLLTNIYSIGAFIIGAALLHMLLLVPMFSSLFNVSMLAPGMVVWVWLLAFSPTLIIQIYRIVKYKKQVIRL
ncbi:putative calcium-translocating P-type ATPase, PMCA-type [Eubacterium nodatum ATCC 33099]|nr:putative calcium-translocating P-type ATPase, PMCA-type [Eubacterium nodatum ATCC 33099]